VLYAYRERLTIKELQRCLKTDMFMMLSGDGHNLSKGLTELCPQSPTLFKDTVVFDFLGLPVKHSEKKHKTGILDHVKEFVLELGKDFILSIGVSPECRRQYIQARLFRFMIYSDCGVESL
jgi:predicted nuclease of restriction endonuclease-like (RecB) superfamily